MIEAIPVKLAVQFINLEPLHSCKWSRDSFNKNQASKNRACNANFEYGSWSEILKKKYSHIIPSFTNDDFHEFKFLYLDF